MCTPPPSPSNKQDLVPHMSSIRKKLVIVGSPGSGKSNLLIVFVKDEFEERWITTVFEYYVAEIEVDNLQVELALLDTAGLLIVLRRSIATASSLLYCGERPNLPF